VALADPLGKSAFADILDMADISFVPEHMQESSGTGGGETLYADRGPALWRAVVTTIELPHADVKRVMALINSRSGGLKTFLLYDKALPYPSSDPDGSIFGSATPEVGTITNRNTVAFTGFPADYVIPAGTYLEITFDTSRKYLGQFCEARTANGSGAVAAVDVTPPLPASVATADAVTVIKPSGKFKLVPNSVRVTLATPLHASITFEAKQTYEADPS
jgi:hypothetical protein